MVNLGSKTETTPPTVGSRRYDMLIGDSDQADDMEEDSLEESGNEEVPSVTRKGSPAQNIRMLAVRNAATEDLQTEGL